MRIVGLEAKLQNQQIKTELSGVADERCDWVLGFALGLQSWVSAWVWSLGATLSHAYCLVSDVEWSGTQSRMPYTVYFSSDQLFVFFPPSL